MTNKKKIYLFVVVLILYTIDRISKILILQNFLNNSSSEIYLNSFLNFSLVWNSGIGFGILQLEANVFYLLISIIITAINLILIYWMLTSTNYLESIFISIILGGALGNLFDRYYYSSVPDFIDLHYESFHWFTFNIADIFITIGIIGSSLEANVIVYLKDEYLNIIKQEDLSEIFICSEAKAESFINQNDLFSLKDIEGVAVKIVKAKGEKCSRCWKILEKSCIRDICGLKN